MTTIPVERKALEVLLLGMTLVSLDLARVEQPERSKELIEAYVVVLDRFLKVFSDVQMADPQWFETLVSHYGDDSSPQFPQPPLTWN